MKKKKANQNLNPKKNITNLKQNNTSIPLTQINLEALFTKIRKHKLRDSSEEECILHLLNKNQIRQDKKRIDILKAKKSKHNQTKPPSILTPSL